MYQGDPSNLNDPRGRGRVNKALGEKLEELVSALGEISLPSLDELELDKLIDLSERREGMRITQRGVIMEHLAHQWLARCPLVTPYTGSFPQPSTTATIYQQDQQLIFTNPSGKDVTEFDGLYVLNDGPIDQTALFLEVRSYGLGTLFNTRKKDPFAKINSKFNAAKKVFSHLRIPGILVLTSWGQELSDDISQLEEKYRKRPHFGSHLRCVQMGFKKGQVKEYLESCYR